MRFIKPKYHCTTKFLISNFRSNQRILASLSNIADTQLRNGGFRPELNPEFLTSMRGIHTTPTMISASLGKNRDTHFGKMKKGANLNNGFLSRPYGSVGFPSSVNGVAGFRAYSSLNADGSGSGGGDTLQKVWKSIGDAADLTVEKAKGASDAVTPHVQKLLESHPYLENVIIPIGWTFSGTLLAWLVLPRVLRKFHKYSMQSPVALLSGNLPDHSYEKSFWGSLEDPVRYLVTFMAFSKLGAMIAPTTIAAQYIEPAWRGAIILSFLWFINRWKANVATRYLSAPSVTAVDRQRIVTLHKVSSIGLFVLGIMTLAEAYGVAVTSILTVGGIGGITTAYAAKDILGNLLSGFLMEFSHPFSIGDSIKAGTIEGKVIGMDYTTTTLVNPEGIPIVVPNSVFSSQWIMNKSRAKWRAVVKRIPLRIDCLEKAPEISNEIKSLLNSNPKVFMGNGVPYCSITRVESQYAELTIGCNLIQMRKDELYDAEQDIILQALKTIEKHGAFLGFRPE
ncbi:hypothetical protein ACHQM5_011536 [Ranunculus cassubicifolius]